MFPTFCKGTSSLTIIFWLYFPIWTLILIVLESHIHVQMNWCIVQLNISYRTNRLFLTALICNHSWSYSKQTNSQAKKHVYMCLKKYYTCQTYKLDLQTSFDIAVVNVIWHIFLGLFTCISFTRFLHLCSRFCF